MGVRKKNFEKKVFSRNFSATFSALYCRQLEPKTPAQARRSYLMSFLSYGGSKVFAKIILTAVSENLVDRFRQKSFKKIAFTPAYPERGQSTIRMSRF
jgi:hypothetical protein